MGGFNFHPFFKWQAKSLETGGFLWWLSVYHESSGATFLMFFSVHLWDQYCLFCSKVSFSCHPCFFANFVPKIFFRQCLATFRGCELLSWFLSRYQDQLVTASRGSSEKMCSVSEVTSTLRLRSLSTVIASPLKIFDFRHRLILPVFISLSSLDLCFHSSPVIVIVKIHFGI